MGKIIVPLDGTTFGERALPLACVLARDADAKLDLVECSGYHLASAGHPSRATAIAYLEDLREDLYDRYGVDVDLLIKDTSPPDLLLRETWQPDVWCVVLSTHGGSGVGRALLRSAPVPVLLMPPAAPALAGYGPIQRILVPFDGSEIARAVLAPAAEIARVTGSEIVLLQVVSSPAAHVMEREEAALIAAGVRGRRLTASGSVVEAVLATAESERADLIAIGTHGRSGLDRVRHGSIAESLVQRSPIPLMTLGPEALKRQLALGQQLMAGTSAG